MTVEEKAKAYDEAIERTKKVLLDCIPKEQKVVEYIFPELAESKDEKIRKAIKYGLDYVFINNTTVYETTKEQCLAWIEKQGEKPVISNDALREGIAHFGITQYQIDNWLKKYIDVEKQGGQKSVDKVEPKFKVGDWIVFNGLILYIKEVVRGYYITISIGGIRNSYDCDIDKVARLWTIQDAKEGDVLSYRDGQWIFVYKEKIDDSSFFYHALYSTIHQDLTINDSGFTLLNDAIIPATKEQRDLLSQKMKDAGYEWDAEKKEFNTIEQNPSVTEWSEDDEVFYNRTIGLLKQYNNSDSEVKKQSALSCVNWLKSFIKHEKIIKYKIGDRVRFFSQDSVFTISDIDETNERYISKSGDSISFYEELILVKSSINKDDIKCGDYLTTEDGTVIKVHDVDEIERVHHFYYASVMTEDGGDISNNFMHYCAILSDCRIATQEEINFLEKWVAHKKYVWVENNVSPDDEEDD